jgi:hypothetical protein
MEEYISSPENGSASHRYHNLDFPLRFFKIALGGEQTGCLVAEIAKIQTPGYVSGASYLAASIERHRNATICAQDHSACLRRCRVAARPSSERGAAIGRSCELYRAARWKASAARSCSTANTGRYAGYQASAGP